MSSSRLTAHLEQEKRAVVLEFALHRLLPRAVLVKDGFLALSCLEMDARNNSTRRLSRLPTLDRT